MSLLDFSHISEARIISHFIEEKNKAQNVEMLN